MATSAASSTTNPLQISGATSTPKSSNDALRGLDMDHFLKLMIAELQNQDPLNPMDNRAILEQIGAIRQVGSTDKLTETLDAVLLGQSLSNASGLIGKSIKGLSDDNQQVAGIVASITVTDGVPKLHVGDKTVGLSNVSDILPGGAG